MSSTGRIAWMVLASGFLAVAANAERINQEGRILGTVPTVTMPTLFNTTNADVVLSAMQIFPVTNPWNEDVSHRPVLANSDAMIAQIISDLATNRNHLIAFQEMNFVLVPDSQPRAQITFTNYPGESDLDGGTSPRGLYPIPTNLPVEGWPTQTGGQTLSKWQTNLNGSDRHSITVEPGAGFIWETWLTQLLNSSWRAANGAKFNLNTNGLRPAGWTSGDAAGLPMFPALVRYDEAERGMVEHACRLVVGRSRTGTFIYPATHFASADSNTDMNLPAMGQRVRLKSSFAIPAIWTKEEKAILLAFKKYGAMVADNGGFFSISVTPDDRWPAHCFDHLSSVGITNFEIVQATGPTEGPRSANPPTANAGQDQSIVSGGTAQLQGMVNFTGTPPVIQWKRYSGPGTVSFGDASLTNTTATFSTNGVYTLMLSASDDIPSVAYDAVVISVGQPLVMSAVRSGTNLNLAWTGSAPPYVLQKTFLLASNTWSNVLTTSVQNASLFIAASNGFFRVVGQ